MKVVAGGGRRAWEVEHPAHARREAKGRASANRGAVAVAVELRENWVSVREPVMVRVTSVCVIF